MAGSGSRGKSGSAGGGGSSGAGGGGPIDLALNQRAATELGRSFGSGGGAALSNSFSQLPPATQTRIANRTIATISGPGGRASAMAQMRSQTISARRAQLNS